VLAPSNTQVERVLHARVPVLKFLHALTGLRCDFSIQRPECTFKADMQK
jgi:DNA polymerase sigma